MPTNAEIAAFRLANAPVRLDSDAQFFHRLELIRHARLFRTSRHAVYSSDLHRDSAGLIHAFESAPGIGHTCGRDGAVTGGAGAAMDAGPGSGADLANPGLHRQVRYPG